MITKQTLDARGVDVTVGIPTRNRSDLLGNAIASVLGQSYGRFRVVVSDNASEDDTAGVVASFEDPRIIYRPLGTGVGRAENFNRLIDLADTEFLLILGDDDQLLPDHLSLTVEALKQRPTAGVAHTGYEIVDMVGNTLVRTAGKESAEPSVAFELGAQFLERSMKAGPSVCLSSALFRKAALISAGKLRPEDGVIDDFPLLLRIASRWDFAYVDRSLAVLRAHAEAASSSLGWFTPNGFRSSRSLPDVLYGHRRKFLAEAGLPTPQARRLARMAERSYRREVVGHLSMRADTGDGQVAVLRALGNEIRCDPRLGLDPLAWRFVVGQLGGRRLRDVLRRAS
jgi:glycosyltransferase involved in cell wall biosynthesis